MRSRKSRFTGDQVSAGGRVPEAHNKTTPTGTTFRAKVVFSLIWITYLSRIPIISLNFIGIWGLLIFLSIPKAFRLTKAFRFQIPESAASKTAQLSLGSLILTALILEKFFPLR